MGGRIDIRPGFMDGGMQDKGGPIDGPVAIDHLTGMVHQNQVAHPHLPERPGKGIDPEQVWIFRIAHGDMAGRFRTGADSGGFAGAAMAALIQAIAALILAALTVLGIGQDRGCREPAHRPGPDPHPAPSRSNEGCGARLRTPQAWAEQTRATHSARAWPAPPLRPGGLVVKAAAPAAPPPR